MVIENKVDKSFVDDAKDVMYSLNLMGNSLYKKGASNIVSVIDKKLYDIIENKCRYESFGDKKYYSTDKYTFGGFLGNQVIYHTTVDKLYCGESLEEIDKKINGRN